MRLNPPLLILFNACMATTMHAGKAYSAPIKWEVRPKICIVESMGDECEIVLNVSAEGLPQGQYCFFQNDTLLNCWHTNNLQQNVTLRFDEPTKFLVKNEKNETVFEHSIDVKARENTKRTRRVRQPWSLF